MQFIPGALSSARSPRAWVRGLANETYNGAACSCIKRSFIYLPATHKTEDKSFFLIYKMCDVNSIPANLRNSKPWTIYQNSLDFTKFPLTKVSTLKKSVRVHFALRK